MSTAIAITGLEDVVKRFSIDIMAVIRPATLAIGEEIRLPLATYPGPANKPVTWASEKQRRWWFAHRREKGLPLEYTRGSDPESQDLLHSWTVQQTPTGALVGTRALCAPWVQSAEQTPYGGPQTEQHKATGWPTDASVVAQIEAEGIAVEAVQRALVGALGG